MKAGHCAGCDRLVWRTVEHPATGKPILLWPQPDSLYAQLGAPDSLLVGIPYCQACAPEIGGWGPEGLTRERVAVERAPVVGYETARDRYRFWYSEDYGVWLRAWLRDAFQPRLDEEQIAALVRQWEQDRAGGERKAMNVGGAAP